MAPRNLLSEWSRLLIGGLVEAGVREAVISPGSRSTPFAWAAYKNPRLRLHSVWDERSAAFFALGQARASGAPSLLICTSGSAAAHYFPALVEASLAYLPVLVLSADRPFELQNAGAAQTIDQLKLFGGFCRGFFELGLPDPSPAALQGLARTAFQAVARSVSPEPGPVHLNARARKPLEPIEPRDDEERELAAHVDALLARGATRSAPCHREADPAAIRAVAAACRGARRGLIICGPLAPQEGGDGQALAEIQARTGFPVLAEPASQLRFSPEAQNRGLCSASAWLLAEDGFREDHLPDVVLAIGGTPTSGGCERLLGEHPEIERHVLASYGWPDAQGLARSLTVGEVGASLRLLARELSNDPPGPETAQERAVWRAQWQDADATALRVVEDVLGREGGSLSEGGAVRAVVGALPEGTTLVLGNSLPIRDVDAYSGACLPGFTVLSQRGANGIDGLVAGAVGAATIVRSPTALLLGDVSLLHDLGSLALATRVETPFAIVLLDNGGGRIFEQLPIGPLLAAHPSASTFWLTPHGLDFERVAALFEIRYVAPRTTEEVGPAVQAALSTAGPTLVHLEVPEASARRLQEEILRELSSSLETVPAGTQSGR